MFKLLWSMCLVSKAQSGRGRLFSKYLFPTKLSVCSTTQLNSPDVMRTLSTKQKTISIFFRWCDTKCFKTKWIEAFSKFLKQKTFGVAIEWFSDSTIWYSSAGTTANNNNIHKWGDVVASLWEFSPFGFVSVLFRSGIEPHAANHKSSKWDACRLFMRIERRFDQVMFDWITSKLSERNKNLN